jgi:hypothetical protein
MIEAARLDQCKKRLRKFTEARTKDGGIREVRSNGGEIRESIAGDQDEQSFARLIIDLKSELGVQDSGHIVQTVGGPVMYGTVSPKQLKKGAATIAATVNDIVSSSFDVPMIQADGSWGTGQL